MSVLGLLFEGDCGTKEKGFIEAVWKNKLSKSHRISDPLDLSNDPWIKSQGGHCKKGIDVGAHPFHRTKMAEKSSLFLPGPSHKCSPKREPLLQGKEIMGSNLHNVDSSRFLCCQYLLEQVREGKGAGLQFQGLVKSRPWAFSRFGTAKLLHGQC